jgi:(p)ppGpp synthase/HD superfamily hydrolase
MSAEPQRSAAPTLSFARELPLTRRAIEFAEEHHRRQRREGDRAPYLVHPLEVGSYLERGGYPDPVVAAAVLHDVLEDTDVDRLELESVFGRQVSDLVALVSEDPEIADVELRKDEVRERVRNGGGYALAVFGADKVSKVRELRMQLAQGLDPDEAEVKLRRHRKALRMLEQEIPGNRIAELLRFELEALEALPPRPSPESDAQL